MDRVDSANRSASRVPVGDDLDHPRPLDLSPDGHNPLPAIFVNPVRLRYRPATIPDAGVLSGSPDPDPGPPSNGNDESGDCCLDPYTITLDLFVDPNQSPPRLYLRVADADNGRHHDPYLLHPNTWYNLRSAEEVES